jgi:hypothetical protein
MSGTPVMAHEDNAGDLQRIQETNSCMYPNIIAYAYKINCQRKREAKRYLLLRCTFTVVLVMPCARQSHRTKLPV